MLRKFAHLAFFSALLAQLACTRAPARLSAIPASVRLDNNDDALSLTALSSASRPISPPETFPQLLARRFTWSQRDGYVNLSSGMHLHIQYANVDGGKVIATDDAWYNVSKSFSGALSLARIPEFPGQHLPSPGPAASAITMPIRARVLRFFFKSQFTAADGAPVRSSILLGANSTAHLDALAARLHDNPSFSCRNVGALCVDFPGLISVDPEILVFARSKPVYVILGSSVRDVLRSSRAPATPSTLTLSQDYAGHLVPVTWTSFTDAVNIPLLARDHIDW